ncbi:MAG: hypothetical protein KAH84_11445 [Thiomargarita sp.]|nr:hypothetical protein [Thiomargarita sp.]
MPEPKLEITEHQIERYPCPI